MKKIVKQWKEENINVSLFDKWLRETHPNTYLGCNAGYDLTLDFSQLSEEEELAVHEAWDNQNPADYKSKEQIKVEDEELTVAITTAKEAMIEKTWATMSTVERKIVLGLPVTREEMGL